MMHGTMNIKNSSYFALLYYEKKMFCWYNAGNGKRSAADVPNIKTKSGIYFKVTQTLYNKITAVI